MIGIAFVAVLTLGAYGAIQWVKTNEALRKQYLNRAVVPGVSAYAPIVQPQRVQQVQAYLPSNSMQSVPADGYSIAFGPYENQPGNGSSGVVF